MRQKVFVKLLMGICLTWVISMFPGFRALRSTSGRRRVFRLWPAKLRVSPIAGVQTVATLPFSWTLLVIRPLLLLLACAYVGAVASGFGVRLQTQEFVPRWTSIPVQFRPPIVQLTCHT